MHDDILNMEKDGYFTHARCPECNDNMREINKEDCVIYVCDSCKRKINFKLKNE